MNIVILSIGRSGSTILAKMLGELGWNLSGADTGYAENEWFRGINDATIRGKSLAGEAEEMMETLAPPWVLKDPRYVWTWQSWQTLLDQQGNLLLWLTRDLASIEQSLRAKRWGNDSPRGWLLRNRTLPEHEAECRRCFGAWTGPRVEIGFERLKAAVRLFDVSRG